jgi:DNA primase
MAMLQQPEFVGQELMEQAVTAKVDEASLQVVRDAIGVQLPAGGDARWLAQVVDAAPGPYRGLITELAIAPMPQRNPDLLAGYARDVVVSLLERDLLSLKTELVSRLQRVGDPAGPEYRRIQEQLMALERARRGLRE